MQTAPMVRTQIFLDSEIKQEAKRIAEEDGHGSMAEVIRQALVFFFASRLSASEQDTSKYILRNPGQKVAQPADAELQAA